MYRLKIFISYFLLWPIWLYVCHCKKRSLIIADIKYYLHDFPEKLNKISYEDFIWLVIRNKSFRNVLYYRIKRVSYFMKWLYTPQDEPQISCDTEIGGGLFFCHGFSTIVVAKAIGKNCWINQQVTIGATGKNDYPTIGNNVHILAGAIVIGNIYIGDNSVIGAGAVVTKDVPPNCVVIGNPAYICRRNGIKVNEKL